MPYALGIRNPKSQIPNRKIPPSAFQTSPPFSVLFTGIYSKNPPFSVLFGGFFRDRENIWSTSPSQVGTEKVSREGGKTPGLT
jgi:hypothetical protein